MSHRVRAKMNIKEDQTAPVSLGEVTEVVSSGSGPAKQEIVTRLFDLLNEKRDSYNGITSSMIYIINSEDKQLIGYLQENLTSILTRHPMKYGGKMFLSKVLFRLTLERPHFVAKLFEELIKTTNTWEKWVNDRDHVLKLQIIALKAIRHAEHVEMKTISTLTEDEIRKLCSKAMSSCDDSTKIDTLSLILQSRSTTKILNQYELDTFQLAFQDALGLQEPSLRQQFLAITNKFLERLKGGLRLAMRDKLKFTDEERMSIKARYTTFLEWLINFCLDSIYCNAYFGSFILTMSTLKLVIQHVTFDDRNLSIRPLFSSRRCYDSILSCLNDSFEENKLLALELLLLIPNNEEFMSEANLKQFEKIAYYLVNSVNPAHSLTCQYVFKLIVGLGYKKKLKMNNEPGRQVVDSKLIKNQLLHYHLSKLLALVEGGVEETRENLIVALKNNAIYPKLTCIRALLNEIDVNSLELDRERWAVLASRIVSASIEACHAVSTVVCNLNPETIGHLPMDLKPVNVEALSKSLNLSLKITDGQLQTISSQMLLISGWKTIKECSLSMGAMCTCFWWPKEKLRGKREKYPGLSIDPIIDKEDIKKIIGFFDHYLRNLRHRGAFEQAYNGFFMVTKRIWHDDEFRALLTATLTEIMNDFRGQEGQQLSGKKLECLKAYVTRRSAGLPFIVQAILNSEHKHDSKTLRWVMDCLFDTLKSSSTSETYQRIHCLNILRALIKDSGLGEKVIPYIEDTFIVTMESFRSDSFPIRNCANMLLKAIVDRTFGVNRLRDDIHRRNKLSFEKFFLECPTIHEKMLKHLHDGLSDRNCLASVHSVMIILFRLKPSLNPTENCHVEDLIKPFIGPVLELAYTCPDFKLREVAAKLAVQLQTYYLLEMDFYKSYDYFKQAIEDIRVQIIFTTTTTNERPDLNRCHGSLALIKNWILRMRFNEENFMRPISHLMKFVKKLVTDLFLWFREYENDHHDDDTATIIFTIKMFVLDVVESYRLVWPEYDTGEWLKHLYYSLETFASSVCSTEFGSTRMTLHRATSRSAFNPHLESVVFKSISILLMSDYYHLSLDHFIDWLIEIIVLPSNRRLSVDLQGSILRLLRQLIDYDNHQVDDYLDKLMDNLDLDSTATHETPFDRLHQQSDNDFERQRWANYCQMQTRVKDYIRRRFSISFDPFIVGYLFDLAGYVEFKAKTTATDDQNWPSRIYKLDLKFSPKVSNTPRSIELLALACRLSVSNNNWNLCKYNGMFVNINSVLDKISYFNGFISSLPDCDVKCLALLYAKELFIHQLEQTDWNNINPIDSDQSNDPATNKREEDISILATYTELLEELADGHHSYIIRETCGEVLSKCLQVAFPLQMSNKKNLLQGGVMMYLLSTLIKLCQDEEHSIRQCSFRIMSGLRGDMNEDDDVVRDDVRKNSNIAASRMSNLINLLTKRLLDPSKQLDVKYCFELCMRIIFNHTKNFSTTSNEEREILFDKSKLNTFADHVATIQSALGGLRLFFQRQSESVGAAKIDINLLELSPDVLRELVIDDEQSSSLSVNANDDTNLGDYNWRLKKSFEGNSRNKKDDETLKKSVINNNLVLDQVLRSVLKSLSYFSDGYWNMLTDTDYPYHELSIFKRVAFVKFAFECTTYELQGGASSHLMIDEVRSNLKRIVEQSSCTTMLGKCLELLDNNNQQQ